MVASALCRRHYPSATADEVDLVLVRGGQPVVAVELERSTSPTLNAGTRRAFRDLGVESAYEWALGPFMPTISIRAQPRRCPVESGPM